jgi:dihydroflavonol-4-reductase
LTVCVTGATGFVGGHVARLLVERGERVRVTYRDEARLERLRDLEVEAIKADATDRSGLRRAFRGCDLVYHAAGLVNAKPAGEVWRVNALGPRVAVEAAAACDVSRVVVTSSVAGIGPVPPGEVGTEDDEYRGGGLGLTYMDAKHEGESEALAAGARAGVEVVVVNPSYVLGVPVDPTQPGETSTRTIGNYLRGRLPAVVDASVNIVDVRDVASGHLKAAERGRPGERYVLGGHDVGWVKLLAQVASISGVHHPLLVLPPELGAIARRAEALHLPTAVSSEGILAMAQNWCYSSRKARRELGYRTRSLERTLRDTVGWYQSLIASGALDGARPSPLSVGAVGVRFAGRAGLLRGLRLAERYVGRQLVSTP